MTCRDTGSSPPLVSGFVLAWAWRHGKRLKLDLSVLIGRSIRTSRQVCACTKLPLGYTMRDSLEAHCQISGLN